MYLLYGTNDFLIEKNKDMIISHIQSEHLITKSNLDDIYYTIHATRLRKILFIYEMPDNLSIDSFKKSLANLSVSDFSHHSIIWILKNSECAEALPFNIEKENTCVCNNPTKDGFIGFLRRILSSDFNVSLNQDLLESFSKRLDYKDIYWTYSELQKFCIYIKDKHPIIPEHINIFGRTPLKNSYDLLSAMFLNGNTLKVYLNITDQGIHPLQILATLIDGLEKAIIVRLYKQKNKSLEGIEDIIKLSRNILKKIDFESGKKSIAILFDWHRKLCALDSQLKSSGFDGHVLFKSFLLETR
jgi:DNA polymerase III delta subunit